MPPTALSRASSVLGASTAAGMCSTFSLHAWVRARGGWRRLRRVMGRGGESRWDREALAAAWGGEQTQRQQPCTCRPDPGSEAARQQQQPPEGACQLGGVDVAWQRRILVHLPPGPPLHPHSRQRLPASLASLPAAAARQHVAPAPGGRGRAGGWLVPAPRGRLLIKACPLAALTLRSRRCPPPPPIVPQQASSAALQASASPEWRPSGCRPAPALVSLSTHPTGT